MEPTVGRTAIQVYGKACLDCSKSKTKCVSRENGQACVKCHRLKKACVPTEPVRRLATRHSLNNPFGRLDQLEGKLDGLISTLTASQPGTNHPLDPRLMPTRQPFSPSLAPSLSTGFPADADECLNTFRNHMLRYFPFIHLAANQDLAWMEKERPFLLVCICAVVTRSTASRHLLIMRIKDTLTYKLVLHSHETVTIDHLLGILTFLAWGHDALINKLKGG
ncbi:hypothetical protein B0H63DRAFT_18032 [Podospora didyma]|uniref:Zn(2)-C6 fungal-type domain-containing protein n=1 Tax=Podospora didyma TaxID=330526 RepID=A0AAE0P537_9PEZI|nr:hypothetical protein B0H63DRAFT_18032 [Podospora didyma]